MNLKLCIKDTSYLRIVHVMFLFFLLREAPGKVCLNQLCLGLRDWAIINQLDKMAGKNHLINKRRAPIKPPASNKRRVHRVKFEINAGGI